MTHIVFKNKNSETLVYYPVPKNANTSIKAFFSSILDMDNKYEYRDHIPRYKRRSETGLINSGEKYSIAGFFENYLEFVKLNVDIKICIIRDPLERFVSAYENRILFHQDKKFQKHTVDEVLNELNKSNFDNSHFLPQSYFLGTKINYFTHVYKMDEIHELSKTLINFFGVSKEIKMPHLQNGRSEKINLSEIQITKVKKIYHEDYLLLDKFSF